MSARTGEFLAHGPDKWGGGSEEREFVMTADSPVIPRGHRANDEIELVPYDPCWADQFEALAGWLRDLLIRGRRHT